MKPTRTVQHRRGAIGLATILVLVILQVILVVSVISGARDQNLSLQRTETVRSFYATESVANMAIRELIQGTDESGDGGIGSIAAGVTANGPTINSAHASASVSTSGSTTTVSIKGSSTLTNRAISLNVTAQPTAVNPVISYATSAAPTMPVVKAWASGAWGAASNTTAASANVAWEIMRFSPVGISNPMRALVTLDQAASLYCAVYSTGVWGTATTLTSGTGTVNTRVFASDFEQKTGNLMVAYRKAAGTSIYYRTYTTSSPSESSFSLGLTAVPTWMEIAPKPNSNEMVIVVSAGSKLHAGVWNGTSWANSTTLETALPTSGRPFHVAYMNKSGKAMVVWTATTGAPKYATWDGSAWSSTASTPAIAGGVPAGWVKLAGSTLKSSDEVLMSIIGTDKQISLNAYSGTAWGSNVTAETSGASYVEPRVDVAFQTNGSGLAVWYKSATNALRYRIYSSGAWGSQQTGPDMTSATNAIHLERGYASTELMMLVRRDGPVDYSSYNAYSQNGSVTTGTTDITGLTGGSAGYALPSPPAAVAGAVTLNQNGGTIAPGAYAALNATGNVTLTCGTYVFTTVDMSGTMTFDTSGGPITVKITTGGFTSNNNDTLNNTGGAPVTIHILGGNLTFKNKATVNNIDILIYNGTADFKNSTDGNMNIYASGSITFKNNGTVNPNGITFGSPEIISTVMWTAGSAAAKTDVCTSSVPSGLGDPCALAGSPVPGAPAVDTWATVAWQ